MAGGSGRRAKKRASRGTVHTNAGEAQLVKGVRRLCERLRRRELYAPRLEALPPAFTRRASTKSQEASLQRHAEKKALVSLLGANASKLEVSVNFHMCVDCHAFMKAASVLLQRPIVCVEVQGGGQGGQVVAAQFAAAGTLTRPSTSHSLSHIVRWGYAC